MSAQIISLPVPVQAFARLEKRRLDALDDRDVRITALEKELSLTKMFLELAEKELIRRDAVHARAGSR